MSDAYPFQNGLKQGDDLLSLLFNFALEHAIRKVQKAKVTGSEWDTSASGLCR
jgi:hypothetical protein